MRTLRVAAAALAAAALAACTSGNSAIEPAFQSQNVAATSTLQFAVGTANIAGATGLNTVVTFRQNSGAASGHSAVLLDTPAITGPAGFVVPAAGSAGTDAGTHAITGSPQAPPGTTPLATTFGTAGGAFAYGFAPANSTTSGSAQYPQFSFGAIDNAIYLDIGAPAGTFAHQYSVPLYASASARLPYVGGPPAYPFFNDGTFPTGFLGYTAGFTDFLAAPVAGTYALDVTVPSSNTATQRLNASATLTSTALLPTFAQPTFTSDGAGGGTVGVVVPAGVSETLVYVVDINPNTLAPTFFTIEVTGSGAQSVALPDNLGKKTPAGAATPSLSSGDLYAVYAAGFDYPAFEAGNPSALVATPSITGPNGQADVTTSSLLVGSY